MSVSIYPVPLSGIQETLIDAKGDLIVGSAADTAARLAVGTNNYVLTADSSATNGVKWAAAAGGGKVLQVVSTTYGTEKTTTSTTYTDTDLTLSITPTLATSKILVIVNQNGNVKDNDTGMGIRLMRDATQLSIIEASTTYNNAANYSNSGGSGLTYLDTPATTSTLTYKTQFKTNVSSKTVYTQFSGYSATSVSSITLMEIGA